MVINMNPIPELITLFKPAFILTSFIIGVFVITYLSNLLIKKHPKGKILIYPGAVLAAILLLYPYFYLSYPSDTFSYLLKALISLPLIFFIPGYVTYNALVKEKLNLDFSEVVFLQVLTSILISGWIALTLAELGYFSLFNLLVLLIAFSIVLGWKYKVKFSLELFPKHELNYKSIALVIILLIAVGLFFHPFEWVTGDGDPGIYFNTGVNTFRTGSIIIYDDRLANMDDFELQTFFRKGIQQFIGFHVSDKESGKITPLLFHLNSIWVAISFSIFGLKNSLYITPLFGLLAVLSIYFVGKNLFNWEVGAISSLLLSVNFVQIWFSRYPASEILTQFLIFSGIFTFILLKKNRHNFFAVLSALCFAEALFMRIDTILLIIPIFCYFGYLRLSNKMERYDIYFVNSLLFLLISYFIYINFISYQYFRTHFLRTIYQNSNYQLIFYFNYLFIATIIILFMFFNYKKVTNMIHNSSILNRICNLFSQYDTYFRYTMILIILILSSYFYFIRPQTSVDVSSLDAYNLIRLSWFLWGPGIWLGIVGLLILIHENRNKLSFFFIGIFLIYALFYLHHARVSMFLPWFTRRYLPVVIPSLVIFTGYLIYRIQEITGTKIRRIGKIIPVTIVVVLLLLSVSNSKMLFNHVEHKGITEQIKYLSDIVDDDVIIFGKNYIGEILSIPLRYTYGKDSRIIYDISDREKFTRIINKYKNQNKCVYIVDNIPSELMYELRSHFNMTHKQKITVSISHLVATYDKVPTKTITTHFHLNIYKIELINKTKLMPITIDMGSDDLGYINEFHAAESKGNTTFRWTKDGSYVKIPLNENESKLALEISINGWRPPNVSPTVVTIIANGKELDNFTCTKSNKFVLYHYDIPDSILNNESLVIEIHSSTFKPNRRELGIMIDLVKFGRQR